MRHGISRLLLSGCSGLSLALSVGGCTTSYSESDLARQERRQDEDARREQRRDEAVDEEGRGANADQLREDQQEVDQESDR